MTSKNKDSAGDHRLKRELKNEASTQVCNSNKEGPKMVNHFEDEDPEPHLRYIPFLV